MKKVDIISYLKILGGLLIIFPMVYAYLALDFGLKKGGFITAGLYVVLMLVAIPMFNYLQYGKFWYWITEEQRQKYDR